MRERISLIKRLKGKSYRRRTKHFEYSTLSVLLMALFFAAAVILPHFWGYEITPMELSVMALPVMIAIILLILLPLWPVVIIMIVAVWMSGYSLENSQVLPSMMILSAGLLLSPCLQVVQQWDKALVLRLGRYKRICNPGPHMIFPIIETAAQYVDTRIRVSDFSAEQSLTKDTVPVHVDALAFWMVWDPRKSILEVESYYDAVILSAQTALRDSIGRNDLAALLSERERLGSEIQSILDAKTSPWGITILSIEFKEILIPKELEDALSKQAQAERERHARIILGSTEVEVSKQFEQAAQVYQDNPTAFQLRGMNMVYDSIKAHGGMVLMPSSAVESMGVGTSMGAAALKRLQEQQRDNRAEKPKQKHKEDADDHSN